MRAAVVAFLLVALTFTLAYSHTDLTPAEVKAILDAGGDVTVVDVREPSEYCDSTYTPPGHIIGAINMPWNSGYLQDHYGELDPNDSTIVVCRSGARSNLAADFLDGEGFTNVFDMLGGMTAWQYETVNCPSASVPGSEALIPSAFSLGPASPNPFNSRTEIAYAIPHAPGPVHVTLNVYNSRGQHVKAVVDEKQGAGVHHVTWAGTDQAGRPVASGLYFYRLTWNRESKTRRLVLLR